MKKNIFSLVTLKGLNLNCVNLLSTNTILGHELKNYKKKVSFFYYGIYKNTIILNYQIIFFSLKKIILFLINLFNKQHRICFFSSILLPKVLDNTKSKLFSNNILTIHNDNWINGLISNSKVFKKIYYKLSKGRFPSCFFISIKKLEEISYCIRELKHIKVPAILLCDSDFKYDLKSILYILPSNDNSVSVNTYYLLLIKSIKKISNNLITQRLNKFLKKVVKPKENIIANKTIRYWIRTNTF